MVRYVYDCADDKLSATSTHVYESSCGTHRVFLYTLSGQYVHKTRGGGEVGKFNYPYLSDVDSGGKSLVHDFCNDRLQVFDIHNRMWTELSGLMFGR